MTDAERALIDAALEAEEQYHRESSGLSGGASQASLMQGLGTVREILPPKVRQAVGAVTAERITPEIRERIRAVLVAEKELTIERATLANGIPAWAWRKLVEELYPK